MIKIQTIQQVLSASFHDLMLAWPRYDTIPQEDQWVTQWKVSYIGCHLSWKGQCVFLEGVSPSYPQQFRWHHYLGVGEMPYPQAWNHYLTQQLTRGSLHSARGVEVGPRPWDPRHPEAANFTECWNGLLKAEANQPLGDNYLAKLGCHLMGCSMYTESETYHVALCPLKEEYLSPGTNRGKQQQFHFLSLPVTRWELFASCPHSSGLCWVSFWSPNRIAILLSGNTIRIPLNYKL